MAKRIRRIDVLHTENKGDQRSRFERDRDRVLYSSAFRRLDGVTQIVSADHGVVFHNRLIHSLKVAQIGRRLAQKLRSERPKLRKMLDPEVVECACLAHDLGHPPFGHIGETELDRLVLEKGDPDGYEGNAQSFRIVTKLAVRLEEHDGLNLSRASLAALLKYPWLRNKNHKKRSKKWGAYSIDNAAFQFATEGQARYPRSFEAQLMDLSDDLAYSVHDIEDFHRAGLIPWSHIVLGVKNIERRRNAVVEDGEAREVVDLTVARWFEQPDDAVERAEQALIRLVSLIPVGMKEPYAGTRHHRRDLRWWTSAMLGRYVQSVTGDEQGPTQDSIYQDEIQVLKAITWRYAILNPSLAAQQHGQARILAELFEDLYSAVGDAKRGNLIPPRFRHLTAEHDRDRGDGLRPSTPRVVADCIASMTEDEATQLHKRLRGYAVGSVLDPILR